MDKMQNQITKTQKAMHEMKVNQKGNYNYNYK